jgi:hypothetical protein
MLKRGEKKKKNLSQKPRKEHAAVSPAMNKEGWMVGQVHQCKCTFLRKKNVSVLPPNNDGTAEQAPRDRREKSSKREKGGTKKKQAEQPGRTMVC